MADLLTSTLPKMLQNCNTLEGDEKTGAKIILKALEGSAVPHFAANAGLEGAVIINKVKNPKVGIGFDAFKRRYVDMVEQVSLIRQRLQEVLFRMLQVLHLHYLQQSLCCNHQRRHTGNAGRQRRRNGNDVIFNKR